MVFRYKALAKRTSLAGSDTRDLIRSAGRMTASQPVLQAHRYRTVIESLSKPKFAVFFVT
jgi:hypothetical protein